MTEYLIFIFKNFNTIVSILSVENFNEDKDKDKDNLINIARFKLLSISILSRRSSTIFEKNVKELVIFHYFNYSVSNTEILLEA